MVDDLPTPEELGERLQAGEITREEAIEIMTARARRDAFSTLYAPPGAEPGQSPPDPSSGTGRMLALVVLLILFLTVVLVLLFRMLSG